MASATAGSAPSTSKAWPEVLICSQPFVVVTGFTVRVFEVMLQSYLDQVRDMEVLGHLVVGEHRGSVKDPIFEVAGPGADTRHEIGQPIVLA